MNILQNIKIMVLVALQSATNGINLKIFISGQKKPDMMKMQNMATALLNERM